MSDLIEAFFVTRTCDEEWASNLPKYPSIKAHQDFGIAEKILSGNLLLRSSTLISSMLGGRVGRGAMGCISTRPTVVGVGLINPYPTVAATGLKSRSRFMNPITGIEAIAIFMKHTITALLHWGKRKDKWIPKWRTARRGSAVIEVHDLIFQPRRLEHKGLYGIRKHAFVEAETTGGGDDWVHCFACMHINPDPYSRLRSLYPPIIYLHNRACP